MKKAAVASICFFDNEIKQLIVEVDDNATWKDAYVQAIREGLGGGDAMPDEDLVEWVMNMPDDLEKARSEFGNGEMDICVTFSQ